MRLSGGKNLGYFLRLSTNMFNIYVYDMIHTRLYKGVKFQVPSDLFLVVM